MAFMHMAAALHCKIGDPLAKLLMIALADRADKETHQCWPSLARLAQDTELSPATVARKLAYLEANGFITRMQRDQRSTVYTLSHSEVPTLSHSETTLSHTETTPCLTQRHEPISNNLSKNLSNTVNEEEFAEFWSLYPRKIGKGQARLAYKGALKKVTHAELLAAVTTFSASQASKEQQFICHAATWLNGERWLDDDNEAAGWGDLNDI